MSQRWRVVTFWVAVAAAAFLCAFVLPFASPLREPVMSAAYTAGANNRHAAVGVALLSGLVTCLLWGFGDVLDATPTADSSASLRNDDKGRLGWVYWAVPAAAVVGLDAVIGWLVVRSHAYFEDGSYFQVQLRSGIMFHRALYRGIEFPYGPLLYGWPAAFVHVLAVVGIGLQPAYFCSLAVMQVVGMGLLWGVVNALPMRRAARMAAMVLLGFGCLQPLGGMNYSVFRFALVPALAVVMARQRTLWRAVMVAGLGEMLAVAVSPELGVAFGGAVVVFGVFRVLGGGLTHRTELNEWGTNGSGDLKDRSGFPAGTTTKRLGWLMLPVAAFAGGGAVLAAVGPGYLRTMGSIAKGGFTLVPEPLPHVLVLLVAVVGLAPVAVARAVRRREPAAGLLVAVYVAALGMLPSAFGRGDALHVFYNGLPSFLLGFCAFGEPARRGLRVWTAAVAAMVGFALLQHDHFYAAEVRNMLHGRAAVTDAKGVDLPALLAAVGSGPVAMPVLPPGALSQKLIDAGVYRPGYTVGLIGVWDRAAEERAVAEMRESRFVLVPPGDFASTEPIDNTPVKRVLRLGYRYRARRAPYYAGRMMVAELAAHWVVVGRFGTYVLWRRRD